MHSTRYPVLFTTEYINWIHPNTGYQLSSVLTLLSPGDLAPRPPLAGNANTKKATYETRQCCTCTLSPSAATLTNALVFPIPSELFLHPLHCLVTEGTAITLQFKSNEKHLIQFYLLQFELERLSQRTGLSNDHPDGKNCGCTVRWNKYRHSFTKSMITFSIPRS